MARPELRVTGPGNEAADLKHLQMFGYGWQSHGERCRELGNRGVALREDRKDLPPRRVRERRESSIQDTVRAPHAENSIGVFYFAVN